MSFVSTAAMNVDSRLLRHFIQRLSRLSLSLSLPSLSPTSSHSLCGRCLSRSHCCSAARTLSLSLSVCPSLVLPFAAFATSVCSTAVVVAAVAAAAAASAAVYCALTAALGAGRKSRAALAGAFRWLLCCVTARNCRCM